MAEEDQWSTRNYDLVKGAVLLLVLVALVVVLVYERSGPTVAQQTARTGQEVVVDASETGVDGALSVAGHAEPGSTIELWAGEAKLAAVPVDADGNWSYDGQLEPGDYSIVARSVDAQGQTLTESEAAVLSVPGTVGGDPTPQINPPEPAPPGELSLSGTAPPGSTVELWAGEVKLGAVPVDSDGNWSYDGQLEPGDHVIVARTIDAEGQVLGESEATAITVPAATATPVPSTGAVPPTLNEPQVDDAGTVTLNGSGEPGATIEIVEEGVVIGTTVIGEDGSWSFRYEAKAGGHRLAVQSQGQPSTASKAVDITISASQAAGGQEYVVQRGDWLRKLARRFYGDSRRWKDIYEATNAKAAQDPTFHSIRNPNLILPGWKLWIPEP